MWLSLDKEDKEFLVAAFKADGFRVHTQASSMVAEKNGQKVVMREKKSAEIVWDMKKIFEDKKVLLTQVGKIPAGTLLDFLKKEKKEKETMIDCFKRTSSKFNWDISLSGEHILDEDWRSLGSKAQYLQVETDDGESCVIVSFSSERYERVYLLNMSYFQFVRFMDSYSPMDEFRDLAPTAYIKLLAYTE